MKLVALSLIYFSIYGCANIFFKGKQINLYVFVLSMLLNFDLSVSNDKYILMGDIMNVHIPSILISMIMCFLFVINKKSFRISTLVLFLFPFFIHFAIEYFHIIDFPDYFRTLYVYLSILIIIMIFKSFDEIHILSILYMINYVAIANGVIGVLQIITGKKLLFGSVDSSILYTQGVVDVRRAVGIAGSNNAAGNFGAIIFCIVLFNCLTRKDILSWLSLFVTTIFSIITLTRIGYLSIALSIIIFYMGFRAKKMSESYFKILIFIFGLVFAISIILIFRDKLISILFLDRGNTQDSRFYQFQMILKEVVPHNWLFGVGDGQYRQFIFSNFNMFDYTVHSQYLNVLVEDGIILLVLFVIFNLWIFLKSFIQLKGNNDLRVLCVAIFFANIVCSNFNPNVFYYINNVLYYFVMVGIYYYSVRSLNRNFNREIIK